MANLSAWAFLMAFFTIFSKMLGFLREAIMTWRFGATALTDAFVISWNIPLVIFGGVATSLLTCYVPMYNSVKKQGKKQVDRFNSNLITMVFLVSLGIILLFMFFDETIIKTFFIRKDKTETIAYALKLSNVMIWSMLFLGISFILQGYIQVHEKFTVVGLMGIPLNLFIITGMLLANEEHYIWLAIGVLAGYAFYLPYFGFPARKSGFVYRPRLDFGDKNVRKILLLILPVFLGRMVFDINLMVDRYLGSGLAQGTVTCLNSANKLNLLVNSVVVTSVGTTIFPRLSKLTEEGNLKDVKKTLSTSLGSMSVFLIPISFAMIALARPIVSVAFGRGAFTAEKVLITAQAMEFYSISIISLGWRQIMEKVFYAMEDTKTPMVNSVISISINIILNLLLIGPMKHMGLALATSASSILTALLFFINLRHKIGRFGGKKLLDSFVKITVASFVMALLSRGLFAGMGFVMKSESVRLIMTAVFGMATYYFLLSVFKVRELRMALNMLRRRKA